MMRIKGSNVSVYTSQHDEPEPLMHIIYPS